MPHLSLSSDAHEGRAILLRYTEWPSPQEVLSWTSLLAGVLAFRFLDRPACLITLPGSPGRSFSVDRRDLVAVRRGARFAGLVGGFWIGLVDRCSEALLRDVSIDDEFELGELWVTAIPPHALTRADPLVRSKPLPTLAMPDTSEELMTLTDDGRTLVWLNPSVEYPTIINHVRQTSDALGWSLAVDLA